MLHCSRTIATTSSNMSIEIKDNKPIMIRVLTILVVFFGIITQARSQSTNTQRQVDVVICMDLSGSTNGLLDNFRDKMWDIINQWQMFTPRPVIRIGLIGFSRYSFNDGSGYVKVIADLTDDYDQLSEKMFSIQPYVENGIQFVGAAIGTAVNELSWSTKPTTVKMMYVMGNGYVNLGHFDFRAQCDLATKNNIVIHTVYCIKNDKQLRQKELPGWNEIASLTGGESFQVYVNKRAPLIKQKVNLIALASLNDSINKTIIPYGKSGYDRLKLMLKADDKALKSYEAYFYSRLRYKLSDHYFAQMLSWDVTAYKEYYPQSKLAAVRNSVNTNNNSATVDLEVLARQYAETRNRLREAIVQQFPTDEEHRIHGEVSKDDYELENCLDKTMVYSFYKTLIKAGFSD